MPVDVHPLVKELVDSCWKEPQERPAACRLSVLSFLHGVCLSLYRKSTVVSLLYMDIPFSVSSELSRSNKILLAFFPTAFLAEQFQKISDEL